MPNPTPNPTPTPTVPSPPKEPIIPDTSNDSDNHYDGGEGDNSGYDNGKGPTATPSPSPTDTTNGNTGNAPYIPLPPSGDMLQNKVVYGRRLNSYMPCRGNVASNAQACASQCVGNAECSAWTFAPDFNCGWVGESMPMGLCYLMADVSGGNIYDAPDGDAFISGFK